MDMEQTVADLQAKNEQLSRENDLFKSMLSVVKENVDLRARMQLSNSESLEELPGIHPSSLLQTTCERQFRKDILPTTSQQEQRTSSPVDFKSFIQDSVHTDTSERAELQSCQAGFPFEVKRPNRVLGEIAYQLDRRILSHVFQGYKRLYGFTQLNIPEKIREVSTNPLTGKLDEGYRLHLTQRYADLMERLSQSGYKTALHPPFIEFIVNNYGILKGRPGENSIHEISYNDPNFLRKVIMTTAPTKLQKDLLLVLNCLCIMAQMDRRPLFLC